MDYDSPWKTVLEVYFAQCMALLFPEIHKKIDWSKGYEFLDNEFQKISRSSVEKRRYVDKLVKVYLTGGSEAWLLFHIEAQNQYDNKFPERMYIYNYRIFDWFKRDVVSLGILGDTRKKYRPDSYERGLLGCNSRFTFPIVKLMDYAGDMEALEQSDNPFAVVVLTHLKAQKCTGDLEKKQLKFRLIKNLLQSGHKRKDIENLLAFIDWLLHLPAKMEQKLFVEINTFKEEEKMKYVTSWERMGEEKGMKIGEKKGKKIGEKKGKIIGEKKGKIIGEKKGEIIGEKKGYVKGKYEFFASLLEHRFGPLPEGIQEKCKQASPEMLEAWGFRLLSASTVDEVFTSR